MTTYTPAVVTGTDAVSEPPRHPSAPERQTPAANSPTAVVSLPADAAATSAVVPDASGLAPHASASPFDVVHDRAGTASLKWDFAAERGRPSAVLPLWVADMDHPTAPCVVNALLWRVRHGIFGYTEPDAAYNATLAAWFARRYDWRIDPAWNVVTPGVVPALATAVRALTEPGGAVVIEEPVYYPFREVVEQQGRVVAPAPLVRGADGVYRRDLDALEAVLTSTGARLLLLCNPHNPVGRVWSRAELTGLAEVAERHDVLVVSDEVHADLALPGYRTTPFASLSADAAARTITCTSPSKSFNLAGLQVANILIADPDLRARFRSALGAAGYSQPNVLGLTACQAAYKSGDAWLDALRRHIEYARRHVIRRLERVPGVEVSPCEGTYLLWLDCTGLLEATGLAAEELDGFITDQAGLWLDDGALFGTGGAGFTRLNIACPRATLDEALDRLEIAVHGLLASAAA
ncbi:pyridoxal phosphate-dependent aminotransferase [Actinomyces sp. Z5]|uniref:MalY/PatB family protein n=1 Tax=Actinomyces sp. Z5 TaxID=2250216 RepID=UPI000DCC2234|nr:MalY/PatB family protein [Actinomyces sp. Z5]RAX24440.1 pyridoxal phosphate-dependent aminotransferase [Actinomyces sp. Z5]